MGDAEVIDLLVAVERLVAAHRDELDELNVFPVPDADTGRNVLATVRAARAAAEQAGPDQARTQASRGALQGARGNAGTLTSQLLRALLDEAGDWATRLARADALARAAVAHPVEGSFLTAVRAAAEASAGVDGAIDQLRRATAAAHAAVAASPTQLEVLARAGVVDSGARAAALVLEAITAHLSGEQPDPPVVDVPAGGPRAEVCAADDARFEVMYLLTPDDDDTVERVRDGLDRIGGSVVVVEADRLVSVHVHTDDIGAALEVGLSHGRPHDVRVEDLHEGTRAAAARSRGTSRQQDRPVGLVVGTDGDGMAQLAAATGATTVALGGGTPGPDDLRAAVERTGRTHALLLPGASDIAAAAAGIDGLSVVAGVDGPARLLAALAVLDPTRPDEAALADVAAGVREGAVLAAAGGWAWRLGDERHGPFGDPVAALEDLLPRLDAEAAPELVTLVVGATASVAQQDAAAAAIERRWPAAEVDVVDVGLQRAAFAVGCE